MKWYSVYDSDGNPVSGGFSVMTAPSGGRVEQYDDVDSNFIAAMKTKRAADVAEQDKAVAVYDTKVDAETLTLGELVKLLKAKGVI